jgi:Restriction endonuclease
MLDRQTLCLRLPHKLRFLPLNVEQVAHHLGLLLLARFVRQMEAATQTVDISWAFADDPVYAEFSLEAKCYQPGFDGKVVNTIGVREVSRLISRIRHRQFGVLVTTSVVAPQAYEEVREDRQARKQCDY